MKDRFIHFIVTLAVCAGGSTNAMIRVESPNGGEKIVAGGQQTIRWQCQNGGDQVYIEFSFTDGLFWEPIASTVPCKQGENTYLWAVPTQSSPKCLIRIGEVGNPDNADESDGIFRIFPCALRMDYDHDCVITMADFAALAQEWLNCGDPYDPMCSGNYPPRIVSQPVLEAIAQQPYAYYVKGIDSDGDVLTYSLLSGPEGMTIDSVSGIVEWMPTGQSNAIVPVVIQVRDSTAATDIQAFELTVARGPSGTEPILTGAPIDGYPNLFERRVLVYTNAMRMAPGQYRDQYMTNFQPNPSEVLRDYDPVEPLYYALQLGHAARFHAQDMVENGCFQHDSCNGTAWSQRIEDFYPQVNWLAENIAYGQPTAKNVVDSWLCDQTGGQCAADGTLAAGHRSNMVSSRFRQIGIGWAQSQQGWNPRYWVQDLISNEPVTQPPIVASCHDFLIPGKISFLLNYRDPNDQPPTTVLVVLDNITHAMNLDLGVPAAGTYRVDLDETTRCREYYFLAVTASGQTWRHPGPGQFLTDGEASCPDYHD